MMFYHKYPPYPALQPFVECYFIWEGDGKDGPCMFESPPNGFCSIVFNYGDPYTLHSKKYDCLQVPVGFLSGQNIYSYRLHMQGRIGMCGIVFKPAALATIYGLRLCDYVEERVDLYKLFHPAAIDAIREQLAVNDEMGKIQSLEKFVMEDVSRLQPEPDYIDEAANLIVESNGMLQVNELLTNSCMSRRTFERRFFIKVGLSPKYFARIRRISYLCNLIAGKRKVDWPAIFYECNYYDQAHFIKDFEAFTGRTPQQYLRENAELANYVAKPGK